MTAYIPKAQREDWRTPPGFAGDVRASLGGRIDLDPCASIQGEPLAVENWCKENGHDGLSQPWGRRTVYVNPIFSKLRAWAQKCATAHREEGAEVVLLLPARTDTRAWHTFVATASAICLLRGRITFVGAPSTCPFPIALAYWGPRVDRFRTVFSPHGMIFRP